MIINITTYSKRALAGLTHTFVDFVVHITKTCLYNFDPLKPHFYIVKLGFAGYTLFLFLLKNIDCEYLNVLSRNMKNIRVFHPKIFSFLEVKFTI